MNRLDAKSHRYLEQYYDNGRVWYKGQIINGIQCGLWELYQYNGNLIFKGLYKKGIPIGLCYHSHHAK